MATPVRRLTKRQYRNSLRELLAASLAPPQLEAVWRDVEPALLGLPEDVRDKHKPFASMDGAVSDQHVKIYLQTAQTVARAVTESPDRMRSFMGCRLGEAPRTCIDGFIQRFGTRAYRHKLTPEESELLHKAYADSNVDPAAVADVITLGLNAPQFLYQLELGGDPVPGKPGMYALNDYELANKLALHFWQAPPDERLLRAAESGQLHTDEGYDAALKMVLDDKKAQAGLADFVREWLDLESLPALDNSLSDPLFSAFVGKDRPSPKLHESMVEDVVESFRYHFERGDSYRDWFLSPYSFAKDGDLARLYGTPEWRGNGTPPQFPPGTRSGLITRAALLTSGSANTRPIKKGVLIRERILCDELPPPDPTAVNATNLTMSDVRTTREAVQSLTETRAPCVTCHATKINPLGFATENYDALGRLRSQQTLYGKSGEVLGRRPINTHTTPHVDGDEDLRPVNSAGELATQIANSPKAEACFARQYVRFTFGRKDGQATDECVIGSMQLALNEGQSLRDTVKSLAMRPEFRTKFIDTTQK